MAVARIVMKTINLPEGNAFGVDDDDGGTTYVNYAEQRAKTLFFVWVSLTEHKWVILRERRGISDAWWPQERETPVAAQLFRANSHRPAVFRLRAARNGDGGRPLAGWQRCVRILAAAPPGSGESLASERCVLDP